LCGFFATSFRKGSATFRRVFKEGWEL
jgi:hypothetical protein